MLNKNLPIPNNVFIQFYKICIVKYLIGLKKFTNNQLFDYECKEHTNDSQLCCREIVLNKRNIHKQV